MKKFFDIDDKILQKAKQAEELASSRFSEIEEIALFNQQKVLSAFINNRVSENDFNPTTGYGYSDIGRDKLDRVIAEIFGAEDGLIRHNFVSGTHTIATALFGILRPGDIMTCATGLPYDTLHDTIGISGSGMGSLRDFGVEYNQIDLLSDGSPDYGAIAECAKNSKMIYIQRSRGYSLRPSLSVEIIGKIAKTAKDSNPETLVVVDNCYGEFVEKLEPTQVGADICIGSLIKNPGGGIAPTGGYIVGRKNLIELCSYRLTTPGVGREVGATLGNTRAIYMGLFAAPEVTAAAVKTSVFGAALFESLGYEVSPSYDKHRTDLILSVILKNPEGLNAFCRGIQMGSPVDAFVTPEAWDMPGYDSKVIMAAGAFTMGSSIELSADGPMKDPYVVFMQGGLNYNSGKTGVMLAANCMLKDGVIKI